MEMPLDVMVLYRKDDAPNTDYVKVYSLDEYDKTESTIDLDYVWCVERSVIDEKRVTSLRTTLGMSILILMPIEKVREEMERLRQSHNKNLLFKLS